MSLTIRLFMVLLLNRRIPAEVVVVLTVGVHHLFLLQLVASSNVRALCSGGL